MMQKYLWNKDAFIPKTFEKAGFQKEFVRQKEKDPRKKPGTAGHAPER